GQAVESTAGRIHMTARRVASTGPFGKQRDRRTGLVLLIALVVIGAVGCDPTPRSQTLTNGLRTSVVTKDGDDAYQVGRPEADTIDVTAPASNRGGNHRMAVVAEDAPVSIDQESCVTWNGPLVGNSQPGVVLRARSDDDHTQLIMVTNNIVYGWRPGVNVHLIDSKRWPETFASAGSFTSDHIGAEGQPLPWRFCARATGDQVSAK